MVKNFEDYIVERFLFEEFNLNSIDFNTDISLNEEFNISNLKNFNKEQLKNIFNKTFNLLTSVKDLGRRKNIIKLLFIIYVTSTMGFTSIEKINATNVINDKEIEKVAQDEHITLKSIFKFFDFFSHHKEPNVKAPIVYKEKDPQHLTISENGIDSIKQHEKLKLVGYSIGDGKVTIGYGHAEPIKKSKFKIGQHITEEKADELLRADLKVAEDGVKRMFDQWKQEGTDMEITQSMYDSMVSMVYNMGVSGFRNSEFTDVLKTGDFIAAAQLIPSTRNSGKFGGLNNRRKSEQEMFLAQIETDKKDARS